MPEIKFKGIEEIYTEVEASYKYHISQAEQFKKLLEAFVMTNEVKDILNINTNYHKFNAISSGGSMVAKTSIGEKKKTFEGNIIDFLVEKDSPMQARDLLTLYREKLGVDIAQKDFSSRLSIASKKKGTIKIFEMPNSSIENRYWWCLSSWFDGDNLDNKRINQIKETIVKDLL